MHYQELLDRLKENQDVKYAEFHKRLLKNPHVNLIGVRTPVLRSIAKDCRENLTELMTFPDNYYEITFIKLCVVSSLKYSDFVRYVDDCVKLIDNWATCDTFDAKCIKKNRENFLPYIKKYIETDSEFVQRYALTVLLKYYVDGEYIETVLSMCERGNTDYYYVHMAVAWLVAEVLVKHYDIGKSFLKENSLDKKTHNKAIQKACESYRLSDDRKNYLKGLKR